MWTLPWEGGLGSPTWGFWLQSAPLGVEVMVEGGRGKGLFSARKLGAEGPEGQGLPQRGLRLLRLEGDKKRSERNGLKSTVPWSLYHYDLPSPSKNFHLQESIMNSGDNSGVEFHSDPSLWDPAILESLTFSLHFHGVGGCSCLYGTHINPGGVGVDFHPQEEELGHGDPVGSLRECSQAGVSSAQGVYSHPALHLTWAQPRSPSPSPPRFSNRCSRNTWEVWTWWGWRKDRAWDQG